jgi:hypothetical protein
MRSEIGLRIGRIGAKMEWWASRWCERQLAPSHSSCCTLYDCRREVESLGLCNKSNKIEKGKGLKTYLVPVV